MFDLFEKIPVLKTLAKKRWLQFVLVFPSFVLFYVFLIGGVLGSPVGSHNIIIVFVWILWWVLLIGVMVPFGSRIWCLLCPFPIIGEWLQRRSFIRAREGNTIPGLRSRYCGCNKPWPKKFRSIWFQNIGFLCLATFSPFLVTRPIVSVYVLGGLFIVATVMGMIFKQRAFCMYICPVSGFLGLYSMIAKIGVRAKDTELCNRIKKEKEKDFNFDYGIAACRISCPTGIDASSYVALIGRGMHKRALDVIRDATPFAGVLGRVCTHPCEEECVRGTIDEPISICRLKRFAADYASENYVTPAEPFKKRYKERVAVIGGGPVGLTCAYHLAKKGYETTVYEALPVAGGMIRVGIPNFHLPKDITDKEIEFIKNSGVNILTNKAVGRDIDFDSIRKDYDAIFVAVGASKARRLKIEGEDMQEVHMAIDFLRRVNLGEKVSVGRKVVVVGGGRTAEDAARSALRLGAEDSLCIELRAKEDIAYINKLSEEEGVRIVYSTSPVKITGENNKANSLLCVKMRKGDVDEATGRQRLVPVKGSEHLISADTIIIATGQYSDIGFLPDELNISSAGTIIVDPENMHTNMPGVFAGGDVVSGPDVLVKSLGLGRKAAIAIDKYLRGEPLGHISFYPSEKRVEEVPMGIIDKEERVIPRYIPKNERLSDFREVEQTFTENMAVNEAKRCLSCGICGECYRGTDKSWACAWFQRMGGMDTNNYCGLCMECVKSCPHDNIGVYWRPFASDKRVRGFDEAWKAFIMMVLAVIYPINLLGPWGRVKDFTNFTQTGLWRGFIYLTINMFLWTLVIFPGIHLLFSKWSKAVSRVKEISVKDIFKRYSYAYVPLGFMAWVCFSIPLVMVSGAYIVSVISDPFGWGWNLFGTAHVQWTPVVPYWAPYIQAVLLTAGFLYSVNSLNRISREMFENKKDALRSIIPMVALLCIIMIILLRIYLG